MENKKATTVSLTSRGIYKLLEDNAQGIIVQIIDAEEVIHPKSDPNQLKYKTIISDGKAKHFAILGGDAALTFKEADEPRFSTVCIRSLLIQEHSKQKVIIVTKMEIANTTLKKKLGDPQDYKTWLAAQSACKKNDSEKENKKEIKEENPKKKVKMNPEVRGEVNINEKIISQEIQKKAPKEEKSYPAKSKSSSSNREHRYTKIKDLDPEKPFVIKVRTARKTEMRQYKKKTKDGWLFTVDLIDTDLKEINAAFFDEAAEFFFPKIQDDTVYIMSNGKVKIIPERYRKDSEEFQIVFDQKDAEIRRLDENPQNMKFDLEFSKIDEIKEKELDDYVDLAAFLEKIGDIKEVTTKNNNERNNTRTISLYDDTNAKINMEKTLWGDMARNFDYSVDDLIIIKDARVSEYWGKKELSSSFNTKIILNINEITHLTRIRELKEWHKARKSHKSSVQQKIETPNKKELASTTVIKEIITAIDKDNAKDFYSIRATVAYIKTEHVEYIYPSCPLSKTCMKKVNFSKIRGVWECNTCKKDFLYPSYRYILSVKLVDETGEIWVTAFDDIGSVIMGVDAKTIKEKMNANAGNELKRIIESAVNKKYDFRILVKAEESNKDERVRIQIIKIQSIN